ncbi:neuropeptide S receptor-like isoform X1 [Argiope bruennichi]|uniref:Vasopressin V1a receptor like protein n=1 Tax=Argiope bruennichi TaxID=94029 RepID=A0A8T0FIL0_ARGBR|nr:neuropeptide S receptor-like isoform X1 [Argiope bruennichi]XP_055928497.1 neuropeptide S receptor-like isoform X1 [Argiope bruennichi]XP_055930715.1 neuropeptide S receptor-like isoform X1 [Argiope bruennichi]XP_055930716.1 neuropeptide S receptor-like isoform X1 [Argiope bruennichi]KAF8790292.1 Vasopressin V1a receptor like protein [Argiope bruennichi]
MAFHLSLWVLFILPKILVTANVTDEFNDTSTNTTIWPKNEWSGAVIQQVVTLSVIILVTLVGNTIIVLVLSLSRYRNRSSRVNIFILNLAIGDLAVCCITMTSELLFEVFGEWKLGPIACKVIVYAQIVTLASTTFILTSMSYDRYLAICRPLRTTGGVTQAKRLIIGSWLLAFVFAIPQIFIFVQVEERDAETGIIRQKCESKGYTALWQRKVYFTWLTTYILIIPAICICYCYINVLRTVWKAAKDHHHKGSSSVFLRRSQNAASMIPRAKIKTLKLTICIIASFIICWTPYFIVNNIRIYSNYTITVSKNVILGVQTLALLNSALNPIFYGYFNVHLRKDFKEIVYRKKDLGTCLMAQSCGAAVGGDSWDTTYSASMNNHTPHPFRRHRSCSGRPNGRSPTPAGEARRAKAPKCDCADV